MELIIGGAYQGKLSYGKAEHPDISWIDGKDCSIEEVEKCQGIFHFNDWVRRQLKENRDMYEMADWLLAKNPSMVIVSSEVGYGIVPMDAEEREYREAVGRVCTRLAERAKKVTRVICGIGTVIKDDSSCHA